MSFAGRIATADDCSTLDGQSHEHLASPDSNAAIFIERGDVKPRTSHVGVSRR
jgi:hypothetical protein